MPPIAIPVSTLSAASCPTQDNDRQQLEAAHRLFVDVVADLAAHLLRLPADVFDCGGTAIVRDYPRKMCADLT
jgi:hypothetical protein